MYGLVLEGGGTKGAYHIGAARALAEMGIEIGAVAGTSVGALNGAMIVQGEIEKAYETWHNIKPSLVIRFADDEMGVLGDLAEASEEEGLNVKIQRMKKIIAERGLDVSPLLKILEQLIDESKVRKSPVEFGIVTFDLTDKKPLELYKENIPEGKLINYLMASANFPVFKMKTIEGKLFIDGGVYNVLPINLVRDKGFKDIIVIRTFGLGRVKKIDTTGLNIITVAPRENLGPVLDFSSKRARKNLKMGYYDTIKVFRNLKGKRYYIKPIDDEDYFINYLLMLDNQKIKKVCSLFGLQDVYGRRALFEHVVPKIADLLELPDQATYEDIAVALIESVAEICGVERFKIYTLFELIEEIKRKCKPEEASFIKEIPSFLRNMNFVSRIIRDKIICSIAAEIF